MTHSLWLGALLGALILTVSDNAYAYLDAGTGSMIMNLILGGVAGLLVTGKIFWHRILTILGVRKALTEDTPVDKDKIDSPPPSS